MIESSDRPIDPVLRKLTAFGLDVAFLVPTPTGINKSIMDATGPVRELLKTSGLHDYESQGQGPQYKSEIPAVFVQTDEFVKVTASLYRPRTKQGDPRIWFSRLGQYASPGNLLALFVINGTIYVFNASKNDVLDSIDVPTSPLGELARSIADLSIVAQELLGRLRSIAALGPVQSIRRGDTGIGMTLEHLLGIPPNSSGTPDYQGIELKSSRKGGRRNTRSTLFAQVPDWKISALKSSRQIAERYGYDESSNRRQFYCTVSANTPNSQGLMFSADLQHDLLNEVHSSGDVESPVATWQFSKLRSRMQEKHPETFWVEAASLNRSDGEYFVFTKAIHTRSPRVAQFPFLVASGTITMDHLIKIENGRASERGPLFKMWQRDFDLLFPASRTYVLSD